MEHGSGRGVTSTRALVVCILAISAVLARVPWEHVDRLAGQILGVEVSVGWIVTARPFLSPVGVGLEYLLVWVLAFVFVPELYPERARRLTTAPPFRVATAGLTTLTTALVVAVVDGIAPPTTLLGVVAVTLVVVATTTSWTNNWSFSTPYVSPVFAVLSSFVPTSRLTDFAALFQTATADPRARVGLQTLFGGATTGFVLVTGTLAALPVLAFPALELLVLTGLAGVLVQRLFAHLPAAWRVRWERTARRVRRVGRFTRGLLTSLRGTAAALLVTSGFLLGVSVTILAVAVAASALRRTVSFGATLSLSPWGLLTEWFAVVVLLMYAVTVGRFWTRAARWLPTLVTSERRSGVAGGSLNRSPGLLVPQALALVSATFVLYPGSTPWLTPLPMLVTAAGSTVASVAPRWVLRVRAFGTRSSRLPRVPDRLALPSAFVVQWLGTSVALVALPGTGIASVLPTTAVVLVVGLCGYFATAVRAAVARRAPNDIDLAYLVVLTAAAALLVWVTEQSIRGALVG